MYLDEANMQKQKKREEQIKRWKENELKELSNADSGHDVVREKKESKVKFPKSCTFLAACASGDTDEVRQHLKMGVNINTTNIDGLTALHQACIDANLDMVKFLIENNADMNAQDNEGWTPLHAAVSGANLEVIKYLIHKNARLDICNFDSDLPIDLCDETNVNIKEYLEEEMKRQSIDVKYEKQKEELIMYEDAKQLNFKDKIHHKSGATPLHVSASKGYLGVLQLLIESGACINALDKDGWTPLHAAAHWEQEDACRILAENGADFEAKNFSGQTPFDVCREEMSAKLRNIQKNTNQSNLNLNPATKHLILGEPIGNRLRRQSDDTSKSSISRLSNEAKSIISDREKKQEKILLSPISAKPKFDLFDNENEKRAEEEKENRSQDKQDHGEKISTGINSNTFKQKAGLHENLKTLSASVKQKIDEDELNEKPISSGNITTNEKPIESSISKINSQTKCSPNVSKTHSNSNANNNNLINSTFNANSSNISTSNNNNNNNNRPFFERRWGNGGSGDNSTYKRRIVLGSNVSLNQNISPIAVPNDSLNELLSPTNRRYSTAPIASKDEQAELIRKQKAKLERHFRRSTQAVSYEDIKSAEATIKGNGHTQPNSPKVLTENVPPKDSINKSNSPTNVLSTIPVNSPPISQHGVSSLSSLFGETIKTNISNSNLSSLNQSETFDKDNIIANDIETDKLLDVIEKSKGFSDSNSTQANRRIRNRGLCNPNGVNDLGIKKINKLIWNEEKCEVEYKEKYEDDLDSSVTSFSLDDNLLQNNFKNTENQSCIRSVNRFNQNDFGAENNNNFSRPGIKRSASQVPSSERRCVSSTINDNTLLVTSPKKECRQDQNKDENIKDYQAAYELIKKENDKLSKTILKLQKEIDDQNKKNFSSDCGTLDKKEKRAIDRRISELEEEVKKIENLRQDNIRLKEENAALIRVISKLSK